MSSHWEEVYNVLAITQYYCGMKIILQEGARCMQEGPFTFWRWCAIIQKCQTQDWIWSTIYSIWSCWDTWQYQFWYPWTKSFQKIYGLYGLGHVIKVKIWDVTPVTTDDGHWKVGQYFAEAESAIGFRPLRCQFPNQTQQHHFLACLPTGESPFSAQKHSKLANLWPYCGQFLRYYTG